MDRPHYTTSEAAHYLNLALGTLAKKRMTGDGPIFWKAGTRVLYSRADLDSWIEANKRLSTMEAND